MSISEHIDSMINDPRHIVIEYTADNFYIVDVFPSFNEAKTWVDKKLFAMRQQKRRDMSYDIEAIPSLLDEDLFGSENFLM